MVAGGGVERGRGDEKGRNQDISGEVMILTFELRPSQKSRTEATLAVFLFHKRPKNAAENKNNIQRSQSYAAS